MVEGGPIKEVKLAPIRNGTVIDHITCGQALNVMKILGVNENNIDSSISIGMHVISALGEDHRVEGHHQDRGQGAGLQDGRQDRPHRPRRHHRDHPRLLRGREVPGPPGRPCRRTRQVQQPQLHHQPRGAREARVHGGQQASATAEMLLLRQDAHEHLRQPAVIR